MWCFFILHIRFYSVLLERENEILPDVRVTGDVSDQRESAYAYSRSDGHKQWVHLRRPIPTLRSAFLPSKILERERKKEIDRPRERRRESAVERKKSREREREVKKRCLCAERRVEN